MKNLIRTLLGIPFPRITREEARERAWQYATAREIFWQEPVQVEEQLRRYRVVFAIGKGLFPFFYVDNQTGEVEVVGG